MSGSPSDIAEPWGQLVRVECGEDEDRFPFSTNEVKIGRAAGKTMPFRSLAYSYVFVVYVFHWKNVYESLGQLPCICLCAGCDLSFPTNKYLSSVHCCVVRDEGGRVLLRDTR